MSLGCPREQFNTEYYNLLTGLEQSFFKEEVDQRDLMQLILSIAKLVEYFDLKKIPQRTIFGENAIHSFQTLHYLQFKKKEEESKHQEMRKSQHSHFLKMCKSQKCNPNCRVTQKKMKKQQNCYRNLNRFEQLDGQIQKQASSSKNKSLFSPCRANVEEEKIKRQNRLKTYQSSNSQNPYKEHIYLDDAFSFETLQNQ